MKLTPEDLQKLETNQVANIIRKLNSGKTLTAREEAMLARSREGEAAAVDVRGYAKTLEELADAVGVDRRTLTNIRKQHGKKCPPDRADGRREVAAWIRFLADLGVKGRGVNNPEIDFVDERALRLRREKLRLDREQFELDKAKDAVVAISEVEAALGQVLAKFRQALDAMPGRIAGAIDEADRDALLRLLARAEKDKLTLRQLRRRIQSGQVEAFTDFHARREVVLSEIEQLQRMLEQCECLEVGAGGEE